jgi:hypothetical protein
MKTEERYVRELALPDPVREVQKGNASRVGIASRDLVGLSHLEALAHPRPRRTRNPQKAA